MKTSHRTVITPLQDEMTARIGQRVTFARGRLGVSTAKLARLAGVSTSAVKVLETGKSNPQLSILFAVAAAMGTTVQELLAPEPQVRKTIGVWLQELPRDYHQAAVSNAYGQGQSHRLLLDAKSLTDAVTGAFDWGTSSEGTVFWRKVRHMLLNHNPLPPFPVENKIETA